MYAETYAQCARDPSDTRLIMWFSGVAAAVFALFAAGALFFVIGIWTTWLHGIRIVDGDLVSMAIHTGISVVVAVVSSIAALISIAMWALILALARDDELEHDI